MGNQIIKVSSLNQWIFWQLKDIILNSFGHLTCATSCVYNSEEMFTRRADIYGIVDIYNIVDIYGIMDIYDIVAARCKRYSLYRAQELGQSRHYHCLQLFAPLSDFLLKHVSNSMFTG